jgi:activator of HSP90 ATPase
MKTFKKTFRINAEPSDIYSTLTNPFTIEIWSGYPAIISEEPGSEFSLREGDITERNLEFIKDRKIIQEWYFGEQTDKSIVTISIQSELLRLNRLFTSVIHNAVKIFYTRIYKSCYTLITISICVFLHICIPQWYP